jgi:ribonuclease P protein component
MPSIAGKITKFAQKEIDYLFQNARCVFRHPAFTILSIPRQLDFARILIVASKKIGNAPQRNRLRRQVKAIFYQEKLFQASHDCAIIFHKKVMLLSFDELKKLIIDAYQLSACGQQ